MPSLRKTLARMFVDGKISAKKRDHIEKYLEEWVADSKYILFNLGVHIGIGFVRFTALPVPLLGSISRFLWVLGNRVWFFLKGETRHKEIHTLLVLFFSFIPFLGYFAYTIPLKKKSEYLAYLYAEHISYMLYNKTFESKLAGFPKFIRSAASGLLIPAELKKKEGSS